MSAVLCADNVGMVQAGVLRYPGSAYAGNPFSGHVLSHGAWPAFSSVFLNYDSPFCIGTGAAAPWPAFPRTRGNTSGSPHGSHPWTFRWLGTTLNLQFNGVCFVKLRILTPLT